jgi:hypothetical protein
MKVKYPISFPQKYNADKKYRRFSLALSSYASLCLLLPVCVHANSYYSFYPMDPSKAYQWDR